MIEKVLGTAVATVVIGAGNLLYSAAEIKGTEMKAVVVEDHLGESKPYVLVDKRSPYFGRETSERFRLEFPNISENQMRNLDQLIDKGDVIRVGLRSTDGVVRQVAQVYTVAKAAQPQKKA